MLGDASVAAVLDAITDGCIWVDEDWSVIYVNPVAAAASSTTPIGRPLWEAFPELSRHRGELERAHRDRVPLRFAGPQLASWQRPVESRVQPVPGGLVILFAGLADRFDAAGFKTVLGKSPVVLFTQDRDLRYTWIHNPVPAYAGSGPIGKTDRDIVPPADAEKLEAPKRRVLESGRGERVVVALNAMGRHFDLTIEPTFDRLGAVDGLACLALDISERAKAEEAGAQLAAQRQLALDAARLGWWTYDPSTRHTLADARYREIYGLADGPIDIAAVAELIHPDDRDRLWSEVEAMARPVDPKPYAVEYRIRRASDGEERWLEARGHAIFEGEGGERAAVSLVGTVADITEVRRAREAIRESEHRFRSLADASPAILWVTDERGLCTFLSREWFEVTGQTEAEALGSGWQEATHPDDRAFTAETFARAVRERAPVAMDYRLRQRDGAYRWFFDAGRPRFGADGELLGHVGFVIDADARKRAEEEVREASRRKDEFLATLAHELRNPLAPIGNGIEVLRHSDLPGGLRELVEVMERQLTHMVHLVDDLLDVSRVTTGKIALRLVTFDVRVAVEDAVTATRAILQRAGQRLVMDLGSESLPVLGDHTRLTQVVTNLLQNASKYSPPQSRIEIAARREGLPVVVRVRDEGIGIAKAMLPKIFDVFAQAGPSLKHSQGGLGLGLALVKQLVAMHGGEVSAGSDGENRGATFSVRLPVATEVPVPLGPSSAPRGGARHRVLVVDDNPDNAESLQMLLSQWGHEAHVAHGGQQALERVRELLPDLVVLDIGMPDMSGHEVAERLRREPFGKSLHLVALTGWGTEADKRRSVSAGFDAHLTKPVEAEKLRALLAQLELRKDSATPARS